MPSDLIEKWLSHVWTEEFNLWFCVMYRIPNGGMHQEFFQQIERSAERLRYWDQRRLETYYACSIFKTNQNRKQINVDCIGAFWDDIDAGPGKDYPDASSAAVAVIMASRAVNVPNPIMVGSGGGLHIYWLLDKFISHEEWKPIAVGFRQALKDAGLKIDPNRSADTASVLRAPGTHNWKTGSPREVMWDGKASITPLSTFEPFGRLVPQQPKRPTNSGSAQLSSLLSAAMAYDAPLPDDVAQYCGQLAAFKLSGNCSEPVWHALAGAMSRMLGGAQKFHEWSANDYPDYKQEEAQRKLDTVLRSTTGPTTCLHFHDVRKEICETCQFWTKINNPLQAPSNREPNGHAHETGPIAKIVQGDIFSKLPDMQDVGLKWDDKGSLVLNTEEGGNKRKLHDNKVSEKPFYIARVNRVENAEGTGSSLHSEFNYLLPSGKERTLIIPNTKLYSATGHQSLAGEGLIIRDWALGKRAITHMANKINVESLQYVRMGWKDDGSFLLGNKLIKGAHTETVSVSPDLLRRARLFRLAPGGSLAAWNREASKLYQRGLEHMGLVPLASLAACLMSLWGRNGAVLLHFVSKTAKGKTLALEMGSTLWGDYDALRLTSDDTRIAKILLMGMWTHLPVYQDELTATDPVVLANWIRTVTEGKDRARGTPEAGLNETEHHWSTVLISASNQSCRDQLAGQGDTADAMQTRLIELPFNTEQIYSMMEMETLKNNMMKNAGYAGLAFIQYITSPGVAEIIREKMYRQSEWLAKEYRFENKDRYYLRFLSCLWTASEIAQKINMIEFDPMRMLRWTADKIRHELNQTQDMEFTSTTIYDEVERSPAAKVLVEFLNEHNQYKLIVKSSKEGFQQGVPVLEPQGKAVFIRHELADKLIYVHDKTLAKWLVTHGHSVSVFLLELIKLGVIAEKKKAKDLGAGTVYSFGGKTDCYVIHLTYFNRMTEEDGAGRIIHLERIKRK